MKESITLLVSLLLAVAIATDVSSPDVCDSCNDVYTDYDDVDVRFVAMLKLKSNNEDNVCSDYAFGILKGAIAMKWAVSRLNGNYLPLNDTSSFIPNVKIGLDVINDGSVISEALFHTGKLLMERGDGYDCGFNASANPAPLIGLLGTTSTRTTTVVADVLQRHHIPIVGVSATVQELSDKNLYPTFIRAVPPDIQQAQIIVDLAKKLKWSYIVGIHSDTKYGRLGMQEVKRLAIEARLCFADTIELSEEFLESDSEMENLVRNTLFSKLGQKEEMLGVVFFGECGYLMHLFNYIDANINTWPDPKRFARIHWILPDAVPATESLKRLIVSFGNKAYLIGPSSVTLPSFTDYFIDLLSAPPPWLSDQWQRTIQEALASGHDCQNFNFTPGDVQRCQLMDKIDHTSYLTSAIDSVYILASLLKKAHTTLCVVNEGVCPKLLEAINNGLLTAVSYQDITPINYQDAGLAHAPMEFVENNRQLLESGGDLKVTGQPLYSVTQSGDGSYEKIAYSDESNALIFTDQYLLDVVETPSECNKVCEECLSLNDVSYVFKSGSNIILGIFAMHDVSETDPFRCGKSRTVSLDYMAMEGFVNSVNQLRERTGIDYGYLIVDDCYTPVRASKLILDILEGNVKVMDKSTGEVLDPATIWVAIGAISSPNTMALLSHFKALHIPLISYQATTPSLSNNILYPYFARTIPSDTLQAEGVVRILRGMKATHVGALVVDNAYGLELFRLFKEKADKHLICVEKPLIVTDSTEKYDIADVLGVLRAKEVTVIVLFVKSTSIKKVLEAEVIKKYYFHYVASDTWTRSREIFDGNGDRAKGSFILEPTLPGKFDFKFENHLRSLDVFSDNASVWLRDFWEDYFRCDMPGSFDRKYTKTCSTERWSQDDYDYFTNGTKVVRTALATESAGLAITELIKDRKDILTKGRGPEIAEALISKIKQTQLKSVDGNPVKIFNAEGNANSGFDIYNIQETRADNYEYKLVGQVQVDGQLEVDWSLVKYYDRWGLPSPTVQSDCRAKPDCESICDQIQNPSTEIPKNLSIVSPSSESCDTWRAASAVVGCCLVLLLLMVVVVVVLVRRDRLRCLGVVRAGDQYSSVTKSVVNPDLPPRPQHNNTTSGSPQYDYPGHKTEPSISAGGSSTNSGKIGILDSSHPNGHLVISDNGQIRYRATIPADSNNIIVKGHEAQSYYSDQSLTSTVSSGLARALENDQAASSSSGGERSFAYREDNNERLSQFSVGTVSTSDGSQYRVNLSNRSGIPDNNTPRHSGHFAAISPNQNEPQLPRPHIKNLKQYNPQMFLMRDAPTIGNVGSPNPTPLPLQPNPNSLNGTHTNPGVYFIEADALNNPRLIPVMNPNAPAHNNMLNIANKHQHQPVIFNVNNNNNIYKSFVPSLYMHQETSDETNGSFVNAVPPQMIPERQNGDRTIPLSGISNPAFVDSPEDEDFERRKQAAFNTHSRHEDVVEPHNNTIFSPGVPISYHGAPQHNQIPTLQTPAMTNVAYVISNPPPLAIPMPMQSLRNPTPHRRHKNHTDYLDVTDPPYFRKYKETSANNIATATATAPTNKTIPKMEGSLLYSDTSKAMDGEEEYDVVSRKESVTSPTTKQPHTLRESSHIPANKTPNTTLPSSPSNSNSIQNDKAAGTKKIENSEEFNHIGPNDHAEVPTNHIMTSRSTGIYEEDNNSSDNGSIKDERELRSPSPEATASLAPSLASNPSSFGFQPNSKLSISSENTLYNAITNQNPETEKELLNRNTTQSNSRSVSFDAPSPSSPSPRSDSVIDLQDIASETHEDSV